MKVEIILLKLISKLEFGIKLWGYPRKTYGVERVKLFDDEKPPLPSARQRLSADMDRIRRRVP
ncbi:MAG: hypothetical protein K0A89_04345 [ANME-2 cluster archaeon]|nr:hypothetical protein [ANME-2 cluster archaeon]